MNEVIDTPSRQRKARLSLLGCSLAVFWSGCIAFGYPGVMGPYWQQLFGVGQTQTGMVVTCQLFALAIGMFFSGKVHMAIGMRRCIAIGTAINVISVAASAFAPNMAMIYAWGIISSLGCSFVYGPALTTVQLWMPHKRGTASGVVNLVFGTSAAIISPLWNDMLATAGYQAVNIMLVVGMVATNIVALILTEIPERAGLSDADLAVHREITEHSRRTSAADHDYSVREALRTKEFWIIWLSWVFMGAAGISMVSLSKSYAISLGLAAVSIFTGFNIANGVIRIVAGTLSDKIGGAKLAAGAYILAAVGYLLLIVLNGALPLAAAAALVGTGMAALFTVTGPITSNLFGLKNFGVIYGLVFTAYGFVGSLLGPALAGAILDATDGAYWIVFGYLAAFCLVAALLMVVLSRMTSRR